MRSHQRRAGSFAPSQRALRAGALVRGVVLGLSVCAGLMLLLVGGFFVYHWFETFRAERFYADRPLLRAMRGALNQGDPMRLNAILLEYVPVGSFRPDALRILSAEGLACSPATGPERFAKTVCHAGNKSAFVSWHVEMDFDEADRVMSGRVLALNKA